MAEATEPDAQTLALYLHRHAERRSARIQELKKDLADEAAEEAKLHDTIVALRTEKAQYEAWIANAHGDGEAYRLSKSLCNERERRLVLEDEVSALRAKLNAISMSLRGLNASIVAGRAEVTKSAGAALADVERLRSLAVSADASGSRAARR